MSKMVESGKNTLLNFEENEVLLTKRDGNSFKNMEFSNEDFSILIESPYILWDKTGLGFKFGYHREKSFIDRITKNTDKKEELYQRALTDLGELQKLIDVMDLTEIKEGCPACGFKNHNLVYFGADGGQISVDKHSAYHGINFKVCKKCHCTIFLGAEHNL